jgi:hypothetical protein
MTGNKGKDGTRKTTHKTSNQANQARQVNVYPDQPNDPKRLNATASKQFKNPKHHMQLTRIDVLF